MSFNPFSSKRFLSIIISLTLVFSQVALAAARETAGWGIDPDQVVVLANHDRVFSGLTPLRQNSLLNRAAYAKAQEMLSHDLFDHYMPDGHTPWDFIVATGYDYAYAGENLAVGWQTATSQHQAWMNSATHRANLLNPNYRDIGVAVVDGILEGKVTTVVVQMFGLTQQDAFGGDNLTTYLGELLGI